MSGVENRAPNKPSGDNESHVEWKCARYVLQIVFCGQNQMPSYSMSHEWGYSYIQPVFGPKFDPIIPVSYAI